MQKLRHLVPNDKTKDWNLPNKYRQIMNDFIKKMLEHGAELDQATSKVGISMIINDAEELYKKHLAELNLPSVSSMFSKDEVAKLLKTQKMNCYVAAIEYIPDEEILDKISTAPMHKYSKD